MSDQPALFHSLSLAHVEGLYADYLRDPEAAAPEWRRYFAALRNGEANGGPATAGPAAQAYSVFNPPPARSTGPAERGESEVADAQERVDSLVRSYRARGHISAQVDPLRQPSPVVVENEGRDRRGLGQTVRVRDDGTGSFAALARNY